MRNKDLNLIAHVKSLRAKAENWAFEWKIIYMFFTFIFLGGCFYSTKDYIFSLTTVFVIFTLLTYKLILIEKHRIKEFNELLQDLLSEKMTNEIFRNNYSKINDDEVLEYLSKKSTFIRKRTDVQHTVKFLVKLTRITNQTLKNIQEHDKKNN